MLSDSTRFVDGQVYLYSEIAEHTFGPASPPDSRWEYVAAEHGRLSVGRASRRGACRRDPAVTGGTARVRGSVGLTLPSGPTCVGRV